MTRRKQQRPGLTPNDNNHGPRKSTDQPTMNCRNQTTHKQHLDLYMLDVYMRGLYIGVHAWCVRLQFHRGPQTRSGTLYP